jgi:hypothetical protein
MRSARDPTRRNRNIGTAKQGHGQDNALVIPTRQHPRSTGYFENLGKYSTVWRDFTGSRMPFLVEETRPRCFHACTVDDIAHMLQFVPSADWNGIAFIVLRQPKRKEDILKPAWGRWVPDAVIDDHRGHAIFLEAVDPSMPVRWELSLTPDLQKELARLREDGHSITTTKRHHVIAPNLASVRCTQLHGTLLHEIGHHVDYSRDPDLFERKNSSEKERFAHRYADTWREVLRKQGVIPFERSESPRSSSSTAFSFW